MTKRYAVWGRDKSYKWLWLAALVAGIDAAKSRYRKGSDSSSGHPLTSTANAPPSFQRNVYDRVWVMENNKPKEKVVFAVIKSMNHGKTGTETHLQLVDSQVGAGWGNNEGVRRSIAEAFTDKEGLIRNLSS